MGSKAPAAIPLGFGNGLAYAGAQFHNLGYTMEQDFKEDGTSEFNGEVIVTDPHGFDRLYTSMSYSHDGPVQQFTASLEQDVPSQRWVNEFSVTIRVFPTPVGDRVPRSVPPVVYVPAVSRAMQAAWERAQQAFQYPSLAQREAAGSGDE